MVTTTKNRIKRSFNKRSNNKAMKNIINELWEHTESKKDSVKIVGKVYNWLNCDNLSSIIVDDNVFWFELTNSYTIMPKYIYNYLKRWANKKGYTYLYDIKSPFNKQLK